MTQISSILVDRPARTYINQLCLGTECSLEDLPGTMDDRDGLWERVRELSMTLWWWCWWWWWQCREEKKEMKRKLSWRGYHCITHRSSCNDRKINDEQTVLTSIERRLYVKQAILKFEKICPVGSKGYGKTLRQKKWKFSDQSISLFAFMFDAVVRKKKIGFGACFVLVLC